WKYYYLDVPSGSSSLVVDLYNMTADVDLYVHYNAKPTLSLWDCRPYIGGTSEQCSFTSPAAGRWWIGVNNYAVGTISYTVKATAGAVACTYWISPGSASFTSSGGSSNVSVAAGAGCAWTAGTNDAWITITGGSSGSGNGTVSYTVAANATTSSRTGTMTIAGQTFTVMQSGAPCTYS